MADYTAYQKKIISRYYDHKDQILLGRLQEIVTELFLAQTESQQKRLWTRAAKAMAGLKVPGSVSQHILETKKPDVLAKNLAQWLKSGPAGGEL
jgi:hypothetical protein